MASRVHSAEWLDRLLLAALALVAAGLIWLDHLDPGVGQVEQPLSAHGLGAHSLMWVSTVALAGLVMLVIAYRWRQLHLQRLGPALLGMAGVAFLFVAGFTTDPWYPWQHALTWTGWVHVIATGTGMGALWLAMLSTYTERMPRHSPAAKTARTTAALYFVLLGVVLLTTLVRVVLGKPVYFIGLEERLLLILAVGWLASRVALARHPGELSDRERRR